MDRILQILLSDQGPKLKHVHVFSDKPNSEFKNRYKVNLYHKFRSEDMNFTWYVFAMSHEKGAVDGIQRTIKRVVCPQEGQQVKFHIYSSQADYIELGDLHKKKGSDSESD